GFALEDHSLDFRPLGRQRLPDEADEALFRERAAHLAEEGQDDERPAVVDFLGAESLLAKGIDDGTVVARRRDRAADGLRLLQGRGGGPVDERESTLLRLRALAGQPGWRDRAAPPEDLAGPRSAGLPSGRRGALDRGLLLRRRQPTRGHRERRD